MEWGRKGGGGAAVGSFVEQPGFTYLPPPHLMLMHVDGTEIREEIVGLE